MQQAKDFISALFKDKPDESFILIWTLQRKLSYWAETVDDAAAAAVEFSSKSDVYVGVGLSPSDYGQKQRALADQVSGIVGLWADIDIQDVAHKKTNLPPDIQSAQALIAAMGIAPTITIHSGHGLQAWWLFREPWIFDSSDERQEAAQLAMKWTGTLRARAKERGWDVDSVFDLARVLRVPGTMNRKVKGHEVPVILLQHNPNTRYNPADFEEFIIEVPPEAPASKAAIAEVGPLNLSENASPPFDKWELIKEVEPKAVQSWERKRRDFQDNSASTYDLSLATYGAMYNWTDQEIVDLLIASRRKHGDDLKLRQDYYARTIARAREAVKKQRAEEQLTDDSTESIDDKKRMDVISSVFGVQITRIIKYIADQPTYRLETAEGNIMLGEVGNLINQNQLRMKVAAACGKYIPKFKPVKWDKIAQLLLDVCEEQELGDEATEAGQARSWVQQYLDERKPIDDPSQASITKHPFIKDGQVHIFGASLRQWLVISQGEKVSAKQMGAILHAFGCKPVTIYVKVDEGKETTRSVWRIPLDVSGFKYSKDEEE